MSIDAQTVITAAALVGAVAALCGYYNKLYRGYRRLKDYEKDVHAMKEEQTLLTFGVLACLKGLKEQGCDGPVTEAVNKIEKHLNTAAHR